MARSKSPHFPSVSMSNGPTSTRSLPQASDLRRSGSTSGTELLTVVGICTAIVVLLVIAGLFIRTFFSRVEMTNLAIHTSRIIQQLEKLATDLRSAESEALAFSLTRGTDHFERHKDRIVSVEADLNQLRALTGDNQNESLSLEKVDKSVSEAGTILDLLMSLPPA